MRYKGILLDIDNTLYDYNSTHESALNKVIDFCSLKFNLTKEELVYAYSIARKKVHIELSETASSHNRLLYFQKMLEVLNLNSLLYGMKLYNLYWDTFLDEMIPFEGIYDFLEMYKNKICLVTDLTAHIQYRKIKKLKLAKYCNFIVTSEEAGREKPHPYMFMMGLDKLGFNKSEVCMVGDSFKKDIFGASNLDIQSIWLNSEMKIENYDTDKVVEVKCFKEIMELV